MTVSTAVLLAATGAAFAGGHEDTKSPKTRIVAGPAGATGDSTPTFEFSSNEKHSKFKCRIDGGSASRCTSPHTLAPVSGGAHVFSVVATDRAGNRDRTPAERAFQYVATVGPSPDTTPPETTIDSGPDGLTADNDPSFGFSSEPGAGFRCALDGGAATPCTAPASLTDVADGTHTFAVAACDAAGNCDPTPASRTWTVDTAPPAVTINAKPTAFNASTSASFTFTASDGTVECKVDAASFTACSSPESYSGLAVGSHVFTVRATDAAGNVGQDTWAWTVDTTPPVVSITARPPAAAASTSTTFAFTASDGAVECKLDAASFTACSSPQSYGGLSEGAHTFTVRSTDAAGNVGQDTWTWTVDTTPPVVDVISGPASPTTSTSANFFFTVSDGIVECSLDFGAFTACSSPQPYSGLSHGSHDFRVRSTDAAGNVGLDGWSWFVN
jgi:hypothetical protein